MQSDRPTNSESHAPDPGRGNAGRGDPSKLPADPTLAAAIEAAFGEATGAADPAVVDEIKDLLSALREWQRDAVPSHLRQRVTELPLRPDVLGRSVQAWLGVIRHYVLELVSPPTPALAGYRRGDVAVRSYRTPDGSPVEAWLDLQVEAEADALAARRVRGQVSIDAGPSVVAVHALTHAAGNEVDGAGTRLLASAPVDERGSFRFRLEASRIDLVIELADGQGALSLPGVELRTT